MIDCTDVQKSLNLIVDSKFHDTSRNVAFASQMRYESKQFIFVLRLK